MRWPFFFRRAQADANRPSRTRARNYLPEIEALEKRWLLSSITLGLFNDTSSGLRVTSDGRLSGTLSDPGFSVSGKTVTFTGGLTGSTTSDSSGNYLWSPSPLFQQSYTVTTKFTDHTGTQISSSSLTFTYDTTAPTVTLTAPGNVNTGSVSVTVSGSDTNGLPDGTTVRLDVDLNNNGSFNDAGEPNYTTATLTGGSATFVVSPALANGTYPMRARLNDKAGNQGTSSTKTVVVNTSPTTYAITGQQRTSDVDQGLLIPFGAAWYSPQTGDLRAAHPLDFDQSPGTAVGGDPFLIDNSDSVSVKPILEATLASDPAGAIPSQIQVQLTFNGVTQSWVNFSTTGHAAGEPIFWLPK